MAAAMAISNLKDSTRYRRYGLSQAVAALRRLRPRVIRLA